MMWHPLNNKCLRPDTGGGFTTVDTTGFDDVISRLKTLNATFSRTRDALFTKADNLLDVGWEGAGASAFKTTLGNIKRYFKDDIESLDAITKNLQMVKDAFIGFDTEAAKSIEQAAESMTGGSGAKPQAQAAPSQGNLRGGK
ncbi:hypothetical protein AGMMS49992_15940 [Clostridia bacterium]|nr:hypothetical protein AGMMS49992_15940 [Clostridia bacterium]